MIIIIIIVANIMLTIIIISFNKYLVCFYAYGPDYVNSENANCSG